MAYLSFARKYRPKDFSSVIGQKHVVKTLKNALKLGRISHAYIFAGPRGVGKTTIARILTKCLNCKEGITDQPCGVCENCMEIDKGSFPDMYEIDAASNRGIDDIRNIKEGVNYAPIKGRYKTYIIDEAHMLTREAFNALLKTLEEPPPNTVFILATTELHKIPETIKSRCQVFLFKPPTEEEIKEYLKKILENEGIPYEEEALLLIARYSKGGVRDAASLLDQVVTYSDGNVSVKAVEELLGIVSDEYINSFLKLIKEKNIKELIKQFQKLYREGVDLNIFWKQLLDKIHEALVEVSLGKEHPIFTEDDIKDLIYIESIFRKAFQEASSSEEPKNLYELTLLKLNYIKDLKSIEELLKSGVSISKKATSVEKTSTKEKATEPKKKADSIELAIQKVAKDAGKIIAAALKKTKIEDHGDNITIFCDDKLLHILQSKLDVLEESFGKPVKFEKLQLKETKKKSKKRDETVDKVLDLFQGKIITYKEGGQ